ncbi:MAG: peptide deformylase [Kiritimatiellia bacterium]
MHGFFARAAQHEIDHLNGELFVDRFSYVKKLAVKTKLRHLRDETLEKMQET